MPNALKSVKARAFQHSRNGLREAILGLLAIRPMSGYDLSRSYQRALQQIWYAPLAQVYPTLRKMQRNGLLRVVVKVQRHRPNRKVYSLTPEGRKLLVQWLSEAPALPRMHHEFIHKLFLLSNIEPAERAGLVEGYVERSAAWAADLRHAERALEPSLKGPNAANAGFQLLALQHLCRLVECEASSARELASAVQAMSGKGKRAVTVSSGGKLAFAGLSLSPALRSRG